MRAHFLQHVPFEGPAHIEVILKDLGIPLDGARLFNSEIVPDPAALDLLVVMGGPMGVHDNAAYPWLKYEMEFIERCIAAGKKVLGICLGAQLIAHVLGADVKKNRHREIGWYPVRKVAGADKDPVVGGNLPEMFTAFHWHGDTFDIPAGALRLAASAACENQAFIYDGRVLALQFHLESTPASVTALVRNCGDELDGSEWVQDAHELTGKGMFSESNVLMKAVMENLLKGDALLS